MKKIIHITAALILVACTSYAQKENATIRSGNKLYKQSNFDQSLGEYKKAVAAAPGNPVANYNLGNAEFRTNQLNEAVGSYDATIKNTLEKPVKEKAFYNKGVAYSKQQNLQESIEAWKNALKLDPNDQEARENLQKALLEQKKQQEKEDQKKDDKDKKKDQKKQDKEQQQPKEQQPQQQQSRLSKKQVEQLLKALAQKEKEVQQKMQSKNTSPSSQDKDW